MSQFNDDFIDFGDLPSELNDILQDGVSLYRHDRNAAEERFLDALALNPSVLAVYFCLYKTYAYQGRFDEALNVGRAALVEAARQAGLPAHWRQWSRSSFRKAEKGALRFALYTLKAMAFAHLRAGNVGDSQQYLGKLQELGELDSIGGGVVVELVQAVA